MVERPLILMYTSFLLRPDGSFKYVVYKIPRTMSETATADLEHEARILQALRGVRGVPWLYGLTHPPRVALVMSFCLGKQLQDFLGADSAWTYLAALRKACLVLKGMHDAGVVHSNLQQRNILVAVREGATDHVTVSVVGLQAAQFSVEAWEKWCDLHSIVMMAKQIRGHLRKDSVLYGRSEELEALSRMNPSHLDWMVILVAFCRVLHSERPAMCQLCAEEVWIYFSV